MYGDGEMLRSEVSASGKIMQKSERVGERGEGSPVDARMEGGSAVVAAMVFGGFTGPRDYVILGCICTWLAGPGY